MGSLLSFTVVNLFISQGWEIPLVEGEQLAQPIPTPPPSILLVIENY
jgi:hypothetical protein